MGHPSPGRKPRRRSARLSRGRVEIQDEGSQLIALACEPRAASACSISAREPAASRLRLAAAALARRSSATDSNACACRSLSLARNGQERQSRPACSTHPTSSPARRLARQRRPRAGRRAMLGQRDLAAQPGRPLAADAQSCSTGWSVQQKRLLDIAAEMVRPGGRLVYAVCSLLSREGAGQIARLSRDAVHRGLWRKRPCPPGVWTVRAGCSLPVTTAPTAFSSRGSADHASRAGEVERD